jgi:murein L,D-transpeptidase YcbB/YkuD
VKLLRTARTGLVPVRVIKGMTGAAAAMLIAAAPLSSAAAAPAAAPGLAATAVAAARPPAPAPPAAPLNVYDFYRTRAGAPLWLSSSAGDSAQDLLALLKSADIDGLNPDRYGVAALQKALSDAWGRNPKAVQRADIMLSQAFVAYVDDLRQDPGVGVTYVDAPLRPAPPSAMTLLTDAAHAPSLSEYVRTMGWMHPIYGQLRAALAEHKYADDHERGLLQVNLERARVLPATKQKYVVVNAAQQRLYMYDKGQPVDSMVVVVGQPKWPTPMLTAYIRFAALNPYWYVPPDLAWEDVGQWVKKYGQGYFDRMGYEQVSDWNDNPQILDPTKIDWDAVRDGKVQIYLRQKPGPENFMGRMKFMFPNKFGVYLHDNPRRDLFLKSVRYYSGGCVRLEDAARLGRWLFGHDLDWQSAGTEQPVMLAQPVPVYITYLTAMPQDGTIAYYDDAYGRDATQLATMSANGTAPAVGR